MPVENQVFGLSRAKLNLYFFRKGPSLEICPVENTYCNKRKVFVSLLSIAQDDNLMSKKVQVKIYSSYVSSMYKSYYFRRVLHPEQICAQMG